MNRESNPRGLHVVWACVAVAMLPLILSAMSLGSWGVLTPDSVKYLSSARTLLETGHFPFVRVAGPPGFSAVLAPLLLFGDIPFLAMRISFALCWSSTCVLTYLLYRRELGENLARFAGVSVAINAVLLRQTSFVLSENIFLPLVLASLLIMVKWRRDRWQGKWTLLLAGFLVGMTILVRSIGVALVLVMAAALLADRNRPAWRRICRAACFMACALMPTAAWQMRQSAYPAGYGYQQIWTTARQSEQTNATGLALQTERFIRMVPLRLDAIKAALMPQHLAWRLFQPPFHRATSWLIGGLIVFIAVVRVIKKHSLVDAYLLLNLGVLALWPWQEGVRLMTPLIPLFMGDLLWAGHWIWQRNHRRIEERKRILVSAGNEKGFSFQRAIARRWIRAGLLAMLSVWLVLQAGEMAHVLATTGDAKRKAEGRTLEMRQLADWLNDHLPKDAKLFCITPDGNNSKTILMGAEYLARRSFHRSIDVNQSRPLQVAFPDDCYTFVQHLLLDEDEAMARYGRITHETTSGFYVYSPHEPLKRMTPSDMNRGRFVVVLDEE